MRLICYLDSKPQHIHALGLAVEVADQPPDCRVSPGNERMLLALKRYVEKET